MRTYVRVPEYGYTLSEHDPKRPWIVLGSEHKTVELEGGDEDFFAWAHREWPAPRWSVQLDPFRLAPKWR